MACGLTPTPQTFLVSLYPRATFSRFLAALWSRSWSAPHSGQRHDRSPNVSPAFLCPHWEHSLLDAKIDPPPQQRIPKALLCIREAHHPTSLEEESSDASSSWRTGSPLAWIHTPWPAQTFGPTHSRVRAPFFRVTHTWVPTVRASSERRPHSPVRRRVQVVGFVVFMHPSSLLV